MTTVRRIISTMTWVPGNMDIAAPHLELCGRILGKPDRVLPRYNSSLRKRKELLMTETELRLIAAAAKIGLSSNPKNG
jgi:hypothetical protein